MRNKKIVFQKTRARELDIERVRELIGKEAYQSIKQKDLHPFFVELLIAYEGISRGKILGSGLNRPVRKFWSRARIKELVEKLKSGSVPVYLFHSSDYFPRRKVGEVLTARVEEFKGRLNALALVYVSDLEVRALLRRGELDTCSLEAELVFEKSEKRKGLVQWLVNAVEKVSGVALGSRALTKPGFAGARVLALAEEFEEEFFPPQRELEQALREKEEELSRLREELARYQREKEEAQRQQKVNQLVEEYLKTRSLSPKEKKIVQEAVCERVQLKSSAETPLEQSVEKELERELARLAELRQIYQKPIPSPPEPENPYLENPLIPKEEI